MPARRSDLAHQRGIMCWQSVVLAATVILSSAKCASAKDLSALAELVVPSYTAMNFAVVCATRQPTFLSETAGPLGNALNYAEHIKDEAIQSLPDEEARIVLRTAADAARTNVLQAIQKFRAVEPNLEFAQMRAWCATEARDLIRSVMDQHDRDHEKFLEGFRRSKR